MTEKCRNIQKISPKTERWHKLDVLVIGAGAAGLMCAIEAGKRGRTVQVIDHANKPGKKILMSGGGRCNFTNLGVSAQNFISANRHFCKSALSRYTTRDFIELVERHGIAYHEKTLGQLFCDHKSKDILDLLLKECESASVKIQLDTEIKEISQLPSKHFLIKTTQGEFESESLVIASGGLSIPTMGASAFGYRIAEQFGIPIVPTCAGLVPFTLHEVDKTRYAELAGISLDCIASCNQTSFREGMLFTHRGLSGPAMLQISSYWKPGNMLTINLLPDIDLRDELISEKKHKPNTTLNAFFNKHLPKRLVAVWLADEPEGKNLHDYSDKALEQLAFTFQRWTIVPNNTEGYRTAEVTLGGVDTHAISSQTFEAKNVPGLYFIGEVLDVTGWLGGYNFQWAWASGFVAGSVV